MMNSDAIFVSADAMDSVLRFFESKQADPLRHVRESAGLRRSAEHRRASASEFGPRGARGKPLTPKLVDAICRARENGHSWNQLAARFGMGRIRVEEIVRSKGLS